MSNRLASRAEAETRSHGTLPGVVPNQWPFELIDESMDKVPHDDGCRLPASEIVVDDPPPEPGHDHRGAQPQHREIDTAEPSKDVGGGGLRSIAGAIAGVGARECRGRRDYFGNTGAVGSFGYVGSRGLFDVIRVRRPAPDGRRDDAGPPAEHEYGRIATWERTSTRGS